MNVFQSALLNHLLNGLDPIHTKTIKLKNGQIFQGTITKIYPGQLAQMRLGGLTLTARLEASLEKGQPYWFRVVGGDGVPRLKVLESLPPIPMNSNHHIGGSESKNLPTLLQQLNLPNTSLMKEMVQQFIKENIPFSKEVMIQGSTVIEQSPLSNREGIQLLLYMLKMNLPVTKETFLSMASLFSNQSMGESVDKLFTFLSSASGQEKYPALYDTLKSIFQFQISKGSEDEVFRLDQGIRMNSGQMIGKTPEMMQDGSTAMRDPLSTQDGKMLTRVPILKQFLQLFGFQHEFDVRQHVQQEVQSTQFQTLKAQLLSFLKDTQSSQEFSQVREQAQFLVNRITAMQLMSTDTQLPLQQIIMQFPLALSSTQRDVTIQWEGKEGKNGQIDEEHCRILFYLQLEHLKETVVDVQIQNRVITLTIYNDYERPNKLIDLWMPQLKEKLFEMNYHLSSVKWVKSKRKNNTAMTNKHPLPLLREETTYRGVDVRI